MGCHESRLVLVNRRRRRAILILSSILLLLDSILEVDLSLSRANDSKLSFFNMDWYLT